MLRIRNLTSLNLSSRSRRLIATTSQFFQTAGERKISDMIKSSYLNPAEVEVKDISGGCGSMYEVFVSSKEFKGKRIVQQHRIVNEILKDEVKKIHGLRISTEVPKES